MQPDAAVGSLARRIAVGPLQRHSGLVIHLPLGAYQTKPDGENLIASFWVLGGWWQWVVGGC